MKKIVASQHALTDLPRRGFHSNAQRKNDQRILGIVLGLYRVIPVIKKLDQGTNEANN
jgi:hypothetical protein